jgi:hypothetical protein
MLGLLAHAFHLLLLIGGLVGVAVLLFPQMQAASRSPRRTAFRTPANATEHERRIAALREAVQTGRLTTPDEASLPAPTREARDAATWRALAVGSSVAAAGAHAAVFPHHLGEALLVGLFFLVVTLAQAAWACMVTLDAANDRLLLAGIVGSLGLIALWATSRTVGLPWLGREAVGAWDVACLVWELVITAACVVGLRRPRAERALVLGDLGRTAWAWVLLSGVVLVVMTLTVSHN